MGERIELKMEERAEIMTDNQWFGMLRMVMKILKRCKTIEEATTEIADLLRSDKNYKEPEEN